MCMVISLKLHHSDPDFLKKFVNKQETNADKIRVFKLSNLDIMEVNLCGEDKDVVYRKLYTYLRRHPDKFTVSIIDNKVYFETWEHYHERLYD